jgi:hypothetical protein
VLQGQARRAVDGGPQLGGEPALAEHRGRGLVSRSFRVRAEAVEDGAPVNVSGVVACASIRRHRSFRVVRLPQPRRSTLDPRLRGRLRTACCGRGSTTGRQQGPLHLPRHCLPSAPSGPSALRREPPRWRGVWGEPSVVAEKLGPSLTGHGRPVQPAMGVQLKGALIAGCACADGVWQAVPGGDGARAGSNTDQHGPALTSVHQGRLGQRGEPAHGRSTQRGVARRRVAVQGLAGPGRGRRERESTMQLTEDDMGEAISSRTRRRPRSPLPALSPAARLTSTERINPPGQHP